MLEQKGVINRLEWMWRTYGFSHKDVILQKTRYTFDVSVWEIFLPLCWGCKMVLCAEEDVYSPDRILQLVNRNKVSCLHFVPGMLGAFLEVTGLQGFALDMTQFLLNGVRAQGGRCEGTGVKSGLRVMMVR